MKKKILALTAVMMAVLMTAGCGAAGGIINVTTAKVKTESGLTETAYTGTVKAVSQEDVTSNVSGKVLQIVVKEGQAVQKGDVLFQLDSTTYQLQANQAQAALNAAQVALSSAQASSSSNANVIPYQTASADAHANYDRMKSLFDAGGISQADFEAARSKMQTADAQLQAAKISQKSGSDSAAAQVASAQAAYELAAQQLSDCTVKAPISGEVSQISIEVGSVVSMQVKAMSVVDNSNMRISVDVLEKDVQKISAGMQAEVTVQALGKSCTGSVYEVAPSADASTGMFQVTVEFAPVDTGILSGMMADVRLLGNGGAAAAGVVYVPSKSIVTEDGKSYVYVVSGDTVKQQPVTAGEKKNQYVAVESGLTENDEVVVQSSGQLSDGMKIQLVKSN